MYGFDQWRFDSLHSAALLPQERLPGRTRQPGAYIGGTEPRLRLKLRYRYPGSEVMPRLGADGEERYAWVL